MSVSDRRFRMNVRDACRERPGVKKQRYIIMFSIAAALAAALFSLPMLLSLGPIVQYSLTLFNRKIAGTLQIQSCSLGWQQGVSCQGLTYEYPQQGLHLSAPEIKGDKGLLVLLAAPRYLGEFTVDQPVITLVPPGKGGEEQSVASEQPVASTEAGILGMSWWERMTFRLSVGRGSIVVDTGDGFRRQLAAGVNLEGSLATGIINYVLDFRTGMEQEGSLLARGHINLPPSGEALGETLISRSEVAIKGMDIAAFLDVAAARIGLPQGTGRLDATCSLRTAGLRNLKVQGEADLRDVRLSGGFLGPDQPELDSLHAIFNGERSAHDGWRLNTFNLQSGLVHMEASGGYDYTNVLLTAKGSFDLPGIAAQVPHLLALHEKTRIKEGTVDFSLDITGGPREVVLRSRCRAERLVAMHNEQILAWETPLSLEADGEYRLGKATISNLHLHTPFFEVVGRGSMDDLSLRASADLDLMSAELSQLFAFDMRSQGKLEFTGSLEAAEKGQYRFDSRMDISDFALFKGTIPLLPAHDFSLTGTGRVASWLERDNRAALLYLEAESWPGILVLSLQDMHRTAGLSQASFTIRGTANLARIGTVLHGLGLNIAGPVMEGALSFEGSGAWQGQRLTLYGLAAGVDNLAVTANDGAMYKEPRLDVLLDDRDLAGEERLMVRDLVVAEDWQDFIDVGRGAGAALIDFHQRQFVLRRLAVFGEQVSVRTGMRLADWQDPQRDSAVEIHVDADVAFLADLLKTTDAVSGDHEITGRGRATWTARSDREGVMQAHLALQADPLSLHRGKKELYKDWFRLNTNLQGSLAAKDDLVISDFVLQTAPLKVSGSGMIKWEDGPLLELQGTLTPDLAFFSDLLTPMPGGPTILTGSDGGPFHLSWPLTMPFRGDALTLNTRLPAASFRYLGVALDRLTIPVTIAKGMMQAILVGGIEGGRASFTPRWDFTGSRPVLSIVPSRAVLAEAPLLEALTAELLAKLHPLFGTLTHAEGFCDLQLDHFSVPLSGPEYPVFSVSVSSDRIRFQARGELREAMMLCGLDPDGFMLKEEIITCGARDGRIFCTPVHLLANGAAIRMEGSMSMDGSLDYLLYFPLSGLKSSEESETSLSLLLQDVDIEARLGGTAAAPVLDIGTMKETINEQLAAADRRSESSRQETSAEVQEETMPDAIDQRSPE
jgi:hypothetical protein